MPVETYFLYENLGKYKKFKTYNKFVFPKKSYICESSVHVEYTIGLLCSELVKKGVCRNFLKIYGLSVCFDNPGIKDYVFMERVDGDLSSLYGVIDEPAIESLFIQTLFAITAMNEIAGIHHHDLHTGNVFYKKIPNTTVLSYTLNGKEYYLESSGYQAYIGDFGFAKKYMEQEIRVNQTRIIYTLIKS